MENDFPSGVMWPIPNLCCISARTNIRIFSSLDICQASNSRAQLKFMYLCVCFAGSILLLHIYIICATFDNSRMGLFYDFASVIGIYVSLVMDQVPIMKLLVNRSI